MNPPAAPCTCRLTDLSVGARAVVTLVEGTPAEAERLAALGVVPGASVRVLKAGSALAIAVGQARLALGQGWAETVAVAPF